jgi:hypothetical protein
VTKHSTSCRAFQALYAPLRTWRINSIDAPSRLFVFLLIAFTFQPPYANAGVIDVEKPAVPLRVVNWNMLERVGAKTREEAKLPKVAWRTSFGSERRSSSKIAPLPTEFDADLVLIQGLTSVREARQAFPARTWRLIISRQVLENDDPLDPWAEEAVSDRPATAIAVRYQPALRVTAQEHLLDLAALDVTGPNATETPAAGTAVRLNWGNKAFWAISIDFTSGCIRAAQDCGALKRLQAWKEEKLRASPSVVIGGQWDLPGFDFLPPPPCEARTLTFASKSDPGVAVVVRRQSDARLGCVLRAELPH